MALIVHYHRKGQPSLTFDLSPKPMHEQYADLVERLMEIMARQATTQDDGQQGHPFYGNQYTDVVLGPKPTTAKSKGVKNIVHELLSSGHPFDFDELKTATGAKLNQQLHNAINELKAGKHVAGALSIEKVGGKYQVVMANGLPAPAAPIPAPATPDPTPTPMPAEKAAETAPPAPPSDPFDGFKLDPESPAKMTKEQADHIYKQKLHGGLKDIQADMESFDPEEAGEAGTDAFVKKLALDWKQKKADAMAEWATATTGNPHKAKEVTEVFPADIELVGDAHMGDLPPEKIVEKWKAATQAAKQKKAEPQKAAEMPAPKKPVSPALAATPTGPHVLPVPDKLVPDDHVHIGAKDFTSGAYEKNIAEIHDKLHKSASANAAANKKNIQEALGKRLKASHHFQDMEAQHLKNGGSHYGSLAATLISSWASSSGDHNAVSVAAQLAIRDAFKMPAEHVETKAFHYLQSFSEEDTHKNAAAELGIKVDTPEKLASFQEGMKDFALAQYHETQDHLAKLGIKELHLVRGMKIGSGDDPAKHVKVKLQPASSFTTNHSTAKQFAGGHSLFAVKVPASQVIGSFCTGYGCTSESEVVVLNHENIHAYQVGKKQAESASAMAGHIGKVESGAYQAPKPAAPASSTTSSAATSGSIPTKLPVKPSGAKSQYALKVEKAAAAGNLAEVTKQMQAIAGASGLAASKAYIKNVHFYMSAQAAKQAKAGTPTVSMATKSSNPPLKNAYYYKKLKEKVLGHPLHNEATYTGLKSIGQSNEKVLAWYEENHEKTYGKKHYA